MKNKRYAFPDLLFALFTATGLLLFSYRYLNDLANGVLGTWPRRLIEEMTGSYTVLVLVPMISYLVRRVPVCRANWLRLIGIHLVGFVVFSTAHTTLMAITRGLLFPVFGLGHYDYGNMIYRYPMEASNDVLVYAIIVGATYFFDRLQQARAMELHAAQLGTQLAQAQLNNLKLQLQPHFLFNTLNAISSVMYEDVRKADAMLARLSEFLRVVLNSSGVNLVSLDEELAFERMYVDIMKARLESRLQLNIAVDPAAAQANVPFMLLQPLLENSIKHGLDLDRNALDIDVAVTREGDWTTMRVSDNGVGLRDGHCGSGHGVSNVRAQLAHTYGDAATFTIEPRSGGGIQVTLRFPFEAASVGGT